MFFFGEGNVDTAKHLSEFQIPQIQHNPDCLYSLGTVTLPVT